MDNNDYVEVKHPSPTSFYIYSNPCPHLNVLLSPAWGLFPALGMTALLLLRP